MRAQRDDLPLDGVDDRRATYAIIAAAVAVILGALLYWGMRDPVAPEAATPQQVIRDNELVAPPAVNTTAAPAPGAASDNANFNQRQLPPPVATVGAGEAPAPAVTTNAQGEAVVIDGELLEEIEEDAQTPPPAAQ